MAEFLRRKLKKQHLSMLPKFCSYNNFNAEKLLLNASMCRSQILRICHSYLVGLVIAVHKIKKKKGMVIARCLRLMNRILFYPQFQMFKEIFWKGQLYFKLSH